MQSYDLVPPVVAATIRLMPGEFHTQDLARHPAMLAVHQHMADSPIYDRMVAVLLAAYAADLGLELSQFTPTDVAATWRRVGEPTSDDESLYRLQRQPLAAGARVFCPSAGLTGTMVDTRELAGQQLCHVRYDLGNTRPERIANLRAALPGETTGTSGLPPDDPFFAEQNGLAQSVSQQLQPAAEIIDLNRRRNQWLAPDWVSVHGMALEGPAPDDEERVRMQEEVRARRSAWRPGTEAWVQLGVLQHAATGHTILAKIWHPLIVALGETEGPHWLTAYCEEVAVRPDAMGVPQAYLRLHEVALVEISSGFDARDEYLEPAEQYRVFWLNIGDLYELQVHG